MYNDINCVIVIYKFKNLWGLVDPFNGILRVPNTRIFAFCLFNTFYFTFHITN